LKLFIGLPVYAQAPIFFTQCLLALRKAWPWQDNLPTIEISQGDGVARSRNILTASFLRSDCTHMLQIDCDLIWSAEHILQLIARDLPVVGGLYPKKQDGDNEWVINTLPGNPPTRDDGLHPVRYLGTGFIMVKREVFEAHEKAFPESRYRADYGDRLMEFEYWPMRVYRPTPEDEGRYLSEDWFFCQRCLDLGIEVMADTKVMLKHLGTAAFPLNSQIEKMVGTDTQPVKYT